MKTKASRLIAPGCVLLFLLAVAKPTFAQTSGLQGLATKLAQEILKSKKRKVAVFGFAGPGKAHTQLGRQLGDELSAALAKEAPSLEVVSRDRLITLGSERGLPPLGLFVASPATLLGELAGADALVSAAMQVKSSHFELAVETTDVLTGKRIGRIRAMLALSDSVSALEKMEICDPELIGARGGQCGVTLPRCVYCPNPAYTQDARDAKVSGAILLMVVVGPGGRATAIHVHRSLGYGLDERAIEAVRQWRFKPAEDANGKPVAVWAPVEINFRIY